MDNLKYIDRFFESSFELMDVTYAHKRNGRTLYTFLSSLHSLNDRLKQDFERDLMNYPEFKILKHLRNYYHHQGDIDEIRVVFDHKNMLFSHYEMIIIPVHIVAKALRELMSGKMQPWKLEEKKSLITYCHDLSYVFDDLDGFANDPQFPHKGELYSGGFDLYTSIYNLTNIIASLCRGIPDLCNREVILDLDDVYDEVNNIDKYNLTVPLGVRPLLTTKGFIFIW